jgi:hypothetical protein
VTIQDLGSIGEFIAALATLATLLYLAAQIRRNTIAVRSQARRGSVTNTLTAAAAIGSNKEAASVFRRGIADFSSLDPDEQIQFSFLMSMLIAETEASFVDLQLGINSQEDFESTTSAVRGLLQTPGGREYWRGFGRNTTPAFKEYVETEIYNDPC